MPGRIICNKRTGNGKINRYKVNQMELVLDGSYSEKKKEVKGIERERERERNREVKNDVEFFRWAAI